MELRPGYKESEIGVIPQDWGTSLIEQHCSVTTGSRNTQDAVENGEFPFFVRSQQVERIDSFSFDCEAVLTAGDGVGTGKIFHYINGKFDAHQRVYVLSQFSPCLCGKFFYFLFSNRFLDRIMSMTAKSSVDSVRREMITKMIIPLPPIAEQQAIADALSDVDAAIGALTRLIAKKRDLRQGAMQRLLTGQTRLPGFSAPWQVKRLGELVETDPENLGADTDPNLSFNYIALENVDCGRLLGWTEQKFATAPSRARRKIRCGDVLIATVRPNLQAHLLFDMEDDAATWVCSTGFCVLRSKPGLSDPNFIFLQFFGSSIARQIEALIAGSNYPAINSSDVRSLTVAAPDVEEQRAIASVLSDMDAEIAALETRLVKIRALKQAMMQALLTGRVRLSLPPKAAPETREFEHA